MLFSRDTILCRILNFRFQAQFELCEAHIELDVQAVIGVHIHSLDDVSCDHLLHIHVAAIEHLGPFHDAAVIRLDGFDALIAFLNFLIEFRQLGIGIQHPGAGIVDQLRQDVHRERALALHGFDDLQLQGFIFLGSLGGLCFGVRKALLETDHGAAVGAGDDFVLLYRPHPVEYLMENVGNHLVQNVHGVAGLPIAVTALAGLVVAYIADALTANLFAGSVDSSRPIGGQRQTPTAVSAEHIAG